MRISDWSSDVCSSDLCLRQLAKDHQYRLSCGFTRPRVLQSLHRPDLSRLDRDREPVVFERHQLARRADGSGRRLQSLFQLGLACRYLTLGPLPWRKCRTADSQLSLLSWRDHSPRSADHTSELQSLMRISY